MQDFQLQLLRIFEFESAKRRMSVIVQKAGQKELQVYLKGAPEIMPDVCQQSTCTSPLTYALNQFLTTMTRC